MRLINFNESLVMQARATSIPKAGEIDIQMAESIFIRKLALKLFDWLSTLVLASTLALNHFNGALALLIAPSKLSGESAITASSAVIGGTKI